MNRFFTKVKILWSSSKTCQNFPHLVKNVQFTWKLPCISGRQSDWVGKLRLPPLPWLMWLQWWQYGKFVCVVTLFVRFMSTYYTTKLCFILCHHNRTQKKCTPHQRVVCDWRSAMVQGKRREMYFPHTGMRPVVTNSIQNCFVLTNQCASSSSTTDMEAH